VCAPPSARRSDRTAATALERIRAANAQYGALVLALRQAVGEHPTGPAVLHIVEEREQSVKPSFLSNKRLVQQLASQMTEPKADALLQQLNGLRSAYRVHDAAFKALCPAYHETLVANALGAEDGGVERAESPPELTETELGAPRTPASARAAPVGCCHMQ
jgi:hypothetical protein